MTMLWVVALIALTLPPEYQAADSRSQRFPAPGPPGSETIEEFRSWTAPGDRAVYLFYWEPTARDLGPMSVASEWPARVAGQDTRIIETSMFMGRPQRVLVTHLQFAAPQARAMIYAVGLDRREFESILAQVRRKDHATPARPR
jgi:hypothetical protein